MYNQILQKPFRTFMFTVAAILLAPMSMLLAQDEAATQTPTQPGHQLFLPLVNNQSSVSTETGAENNLQQHSASDYVLAELARQRNEPPFVVDDSVQAAATGPLNVVGQWGPVKSWPFVYASAANLPDGRIIAWGGNNRTYFNGGQYTYTGVWNPNTDQISEIGYNQHSMFCAIPTMREDGQLFVVGGDGPTKNRTSLFDFRTNNWSHIATANTGRWYNGSLQLPNGQVFMALGTEGSRYPELWTEGQG